MSRIEPRTFAAKLTLKAFLVSDSCFTVGFKRLVFTEVTSSEFGIYSGLSLVESLTRLSTCKRQNADKIEASRLPELLDGAFYLRRGATVLPALPLLNHPELFVRARYQ